MVLVFVVAVLQAVPANLIANWLTNSMTLLRARAVSAGRRPAWDVRFKETPDGDVDFEARYWLDDDERAVEALKSVVEMLKSRGKGE